MSALYLGGARLDLIEMMLATYPCPESLDDKRLMKFLEAYEHKVIFGTDSHAIFQYFAALISGFNNPSNSQALFIFVLGALQFFGSDKAMTVVKNKKRLTNLFFILYYMFIIY